MPLETPALLLLPHLHTCVLLRLLPVPRASSSIHPTALNFINLLPNYATLHQLNATSYDAYVSEFVSTVKPQILCMDYYPMMQPSGDTREGCKWGAQQAHTLVLFLCVYPPPRQN